MNLGKPAAETEVAKARAPSFLAPSTSADCSSADAGRVESANPVASRPVKTLRRPNSMASSQSGIAPNRWTQSDSTASPRRKANAGSALSRPRVAGLERVAEYPEEDGRQHDRRGKRQHPRHDHIEDRGPLQPG